MAEILNVSCKKPLGPCFSLLWGCYVVPLDTFSSSFSCISQKEWICNPQKNIVHWNLVVNLSYSFCIIFNSILFEHNLLIYSFHSFAFPRTRTGHRTDIAVSFFCLNLNHIPLQCLKKPNTFLERGSALEIKTVLILVKFPYSPILHYAFSSWIEETMTKTIRCQ